MASVSFLDTTTAGDTDNYDSPWIAVYYVSDCVDRSYLDTAYDYVVDCLENTYNTGYISGYTVKKRAINGWCPGCCGNSKIYDQWNNKRDELYLTHTGEHVLIHSCAYGECNVHVGTRDGNNPWAADCGAVATTDEGISSNEGVAETVMHEALHGYCRRDLCDNVDDMIVDNEHDLGEVKYIDGEHSETPFGTESASERGTCDTKSGWPPERFTHELSKCERKGIKESAEHTAGFHDCSRCT